MDHHELHVTYNNTDNYNYMVLKYINEKINILRQLGITVKAVRHTVEDLRNSRKCAELKRMNITSLPSLRIGKEVIVGSEKIISTYENIIRERVLNIRKNSTAARQPPRRVDDYVPDLKSFYAEEMSVGAMKDDKQDDDLLEPPPQTRDVSISLSAPGSSVSSSKRYQKDSDSYDVIKKSSVRSSELMAAAERSGGAADDDENTAVDDLMERAYLSKLE